MMAVAEEIEVVLQEAGAALSCSIIERQFIGRGFPWSLDKIYKTSERACEDRSSHEIRFLKSSAGYCVNPKLGRAPRKGPLADLRELLSKSVGNPYRLHCEPDLDKAGVQPIQQARPRRPFASSMTGLVGGVCRIERERSQRMHCWHPQPTIY